MCFYTFSHSNNKTFANLNNDFIKIIPIFYQVRSLFNSRSIQITRLARFSIFMWVIILYYYTILAIILAYCLYFYSTDVIFWLFNGKFNSNERYEVYLNNKQCVIWYLVISAELEKIEKNKCNEQTIHLTIFRHENSLN